MTAKKQRSVWALQGEISALKFIVKTQRAQAIRDAKRLRSIKRIVDGRFK